VIPTVFDWVIVFVLRREICKATVVTAQVDNATAKTMATFIIHMARFDPHIIRTHIDQLTDLLTTEVSCRKNILIEEMSANFFNYRTIIFELLFSLLFVP
jgi:hypothetical protein